MICSTLRAESCMIADCARVYIDPTQRQQQQQQQQGINFLLKQYAKVIFIFVYKKSLSFLHRCRRFITIAHHQLCGGARALESRQSSWRLTSRRWWWWWRRCTKRVSCVPTCSRRRRRRTSCCNSRRRGRIQQQQQQEQKEQTQFPIWFIDCCTTSQGDACCSITVNLQFKSPFVLMLLLLPFVGLLLFLKQVPKSEQILH